MRARDGFKDPIRLTTWTVLFGYLTAASGLVMSVGMWRHPFPEGDGPLDGVHLFLALIALVYVLALVITAVLGLVWTFRVAWSVRHLGAKGFDSSPAMSVGWYFVPFANIVMPYRALRQVYSASMDPTGWKDETRPIVATWWWLLILSGVLSNIGGMGSDTINALDVVATVLLTAAATVFAVIARRIASAQVANYARHAELAVAPPTIA
jgi:hypothetical protein